MIFEFSYRMAKLIINVDLGIAYQYAKKTLYIFHTFPIIASFLFFFQIDSSYFLFCYVPSERFGNLIT